MKENVTLNRGGLKIKNYGRPVSTFEYNKIMIYLVQNAEIQYFRFL